MGGSSPLDPQRSCTCCREALIREATQVTDSKVGSWVLFRCPVCDAPDPWKAPPAAK